MVEILSAVINVWFTIAFLFLWQYRHPPFKNGFNVRRFYRLRFNYTTIFEIRICKYNRNHGIFARRRSYPTPFRVGIPGRSRRQTIWIWRVRWFYITYGNSWHNGFRTILANRLHITRLWLVYFVSYTHYNINIYVFPRTKTRPELRGNRTGCWEFVCLNPDFCFTSVRRIARIRVICGK